MSERNPPDGNIYKVEKVYVHDDFYGSKADWVNDIGILLLKNRLKFNEKTVRKIKLPKKNDNKFPRQNAKCRTAGIKHKLMENSYFTKNLNRLGSHKKYRDKKEFQSLENRKN